jgi:hypothetical protein
MGRPLYMRHNFPAIEALEAGKIDMKRLAAVTPGVDPEVTLVREARAWFEKVYLSNSVAIAFPHVIYFHSRVYRLPRSEVARLVVHELVHVSQWRSEGSLRFLALYLFDYLRGRVRRMGHRRAYAAIRYEVKAREAVDYVVRR